MDDTKTPTKRAPRKRAAAPVERTRADVRRDAGRIGGTARAQALTPEQRREISASGAAKVNSAEALATRLLRKWKTKGEITPRERDRIAETLSGCPGLLSRMLKLSPELNPDLQVDAS